MLYARWAEAWIQMRRIPLHMDPPSILSVGYIQVLRPRPAAGLQVQRESTAILSLQEAMDFVNTLHPGGIREPMF